MESTESSRGLTGMTKSSNNTDFDKFKYYSAAVQSPDEDVKFFQRVFQETRGHLPKSLLLREDFCSTAAICCEWVKLNPSYAAVGVDLDSEPLKYSEENYMSKLADSERERITLLKENVLNKDLPQADLIAATNFSYFIFKERKVLKDYFANALNGLKDDGILILDCFGGSKCYEANEEETEYEDQNFSYFWDQDTYDPLTNHGMFYIHFKRKGEKKREKVFTYDWRLWAIPELRDLLTEVGFKSVSVYWEGTDEDGDGDGEFTRVKDGEPGEECESWICYLVCEK